MEVSYYEISIVQLNINGGVAQENTRQTTGDEHGNKADGIKAGGGKRILPRKGGDQLNTFTADGTAMIKGKDHKEIRKERIHP